MVAVIFGEIIALGNRELLVGTVLVLMISGFEVINYTKNKDDSINIGRLINFCFFVAVGIFLFKTQTNDYAVVEKLGDKENGEIRGIINDIIEKEDKSILVLKELKFYRRTSDEGCISLGSVYVYYDGNEKVSIGDYIQCSNAQYRAFSRARNKGNFDSETYYHSIGITASFYTKNLKNIGTRKSILLFLRQKIFRIKKTLKKVLYEICDTETASVLEAMLLGDKSNMHEETANIFKDAGIFHVCCVSGTHMAVIGMGIYILLRKVRGYCFSVGVAAAFIICYGILTGMGMSVMRAVIMILLKLVADILGRTYDMISAMSLSSIIIIFIYPYAILNTGFALSYAAVAGVCFVMPVVNHVFIREGIKYEKLLKSFSVCFSVQIATLPVMAFCNSEISAYGMFLNLVVIPIASYILISGLAGMIMGIIAVSCGSFFVAISSYGISFYKQIAQAALRVPGAVINTGKPHFFQIIIYYIILAVFLFIGWNYYERDNEFPEEFYYVRYIKKAAIVVGIMLLFGTILYRKRNDLEMYVIDTGQGDSICIKASDGTNYLIDAGSTDVKDTGKYRILPCLKANAVGSIDYLIVTHPDEDHVNGIEELLKERHNNKSYVSNIVIPRIQGYDALFSDIIKLAKWYGVNVITIKKGDRWSGENYSMECIYPDENINNEDVNEKCTVMKLDVGGIKVLCMGDLGEEGEVELLKNKSAIQDIDILKVGHHGSKNSSCQDFLQVCKPRLALISCGVENRYGHPHAETLERLENIGAKIFRTDYSGEISVYVNNSRINVSTYT